MVQSILSFKKMLIKRQYGSAHILFLENSYQKTIWFNPYTLVRKFLPKDNMVQPILSFKKILTRRQYGSNHIVLWFKILSFQKILIKRKELFYPYRLY